MLNKPRYIAEANIADSPTAYPWDEWNVENAYQPADPDLTDRMAYLSHRANVAMCIAMAEWVVWRFEKLSDDPIPLKYLEAAWAGNVHTAYVRYVETTDDDWRGVVRGPLNIALSIVIDLMWGFKDTTPGENVAWMSNLVELVLSDSQAFKEWRKACMHRLEQYFPRPEEDIDDLFEDEPDLGPWVPRELFDPGIPFDPRMTRLLIKQFIKSLDYKANEFFHTPEEMLEFPDYNDTPYTLPQE